jgi:hypothetical protein
VASLAKQLEEVVAAREFKRSFALSEERQLGAVHL